MSRILKSNFSLPVFSLLLGIASLSIFFLFTTPAQAAPQCYCNNIQPLAEACRKSGSIDAYIPNITTEESCRLTCVALGANVGVTCPQGCDDYVWDEPDAEALAQKGITPRENKTDSCPMVFPDHPIRGVDYECACPYHPTEKSVSGVTCAGRYFELGNSFIKNNGTGSHEATQYGKLTGAGALTECQHLCQVTWTQAGFGADYDPATAKIFAPKTPDWATPGMPLPFCLYKPEGFDAAAKKLTCPDVVTAYLGQGTCEPKKCYCTYPDDFSIKTCRGLTMYAGEVAEDAICRTICDEGKLNYKKSVVEDVIAGARDCNFRASEQCNKAYGAACTLTSSDIAAGQKRVAALDAKAEADATRGSSVSLSLPLSGKSVPQIIANVLQAVLGVAGAIALLLFVYGGVLYMISGGNQDRLAQAKRTLIWSALGLTIILTSYSIVYFIITAVQ